MTNADMMVIFDVIITIMGSYIIFSTIKMKKDGMVPNLFVPVEEMTKCKDQPGFMPFFSRGRSSLGLCLLSLASRACAMICS